MLAKNFGPIFTDGFYKIPYNNVSAFKEALKLDVVAFLVEPIQGEGRKYICAG